MKTYKLIKGDKTYGIYRGSTIYVALSQAKWIYPWAQLKDLKLLIYKKGISKKLKKN